MYTDPKIYNPLEGKKRAFISFHFNGVRYRYYNGKALGIDCNPNWFSTPNERERLLKQLVREYSRALLQGWTPEKRGTSVPQEVKALPLRERLAQLCTTIQASSYSKTYRRDLISTSEQFMEFLKAQNKVNILPDNILTSDAERFLQQFSVSGTYYQNKRRNLTTVFSKLVRLGYCQSNPVLNTSKRKSKAVLHKAYTPNQLVNLLPYLKSHHPNLFLCALLMYGTLLRPHQEIRLLKRRHFNEDFTQFVLDGHENKSGRIRSLPVPNYVKEALYERGIDKMGPDVNIFTGSLDSFNAYYFNLLWCRAKGRMLMLGLIHPKQTLYSFRHAASINVFSRTQNLKLLQQLFDHSSLNTSLIYLRSIGVIQVDRSIMPDLLGKKVEERTSIEEISLPFDLVPTDDQQ